MKKCSDIYDKYPQLFIKNCIDCESGWYDIIDHMCAAIQVYLEHELADEEIDPYFTSIKEKFGILRIEVQNADKVINTIVKGCEKLSCQICEYCGRDGELYCSSRYKNWSHYKTLCLDHAIELFYYRLWREEDF